MSMGPMWGDVVCKCGMIHYEDFGTLAIVRGKCSACLLADKILENEYEVVSLIKCILINSKDVRHIVGERVDDLSESKIDEIVTRLCEQNNIQDDIIKSGLQINSHSMSEVKRVLYYCGDLSEKLRLDMDKYFKCASIDQFAKHVTDGLRVRLELQNKNN